MSKNLRITFSLLLLVLFSAFMMNCDTVVTSPESKNVDGEAQGMVIKSLWEM